MFSHTGLIRLNFDSTALSRSLVDKKSGLLLALGFVNGLSSPHQAFEKLHGGFAIALQEQGMGQGELDRACDRLAGEIVLQGVNVLVAKSDLPFDSRWFIMGDIGSLLDLADMDRISLPFDRMLYGPILVEFEHYQD